SGGSGTFVGDLLYGSHAGVEVQDGSSFAGVLSIFAGHESNGMLAYNNAVTAAPLCSFENNGPASNDFSIFLNTGGQLNVQHCTFAPAGRPALYDNAGNQAQATNDWWSADSGPQLQGGGGGSGAIIGWNASNASSVAWQPFLTASPVVSAV